MLFNKRLPCGQRFVGNPLRRYSVSIAPISVIDDISNDDEEDAYEEMDEEDDDPLASEVKAASFSYQEVECAVEPSGSYTERCIICGRIATPKTRLFKWPDDQDLRRSWLTFFRLDADYLSNSKEYYICDVHFDANQFLYEGDRIYWKKNSFPRFRQRRTILADPFPWEMSFNSDKQQASHPIHPHRMKQGLQREHIVTFRESFFKNKAKASHPVAVVSLPENPNIFYEFSYTRTSSVDSSKFYSCLKCRKAKNDTKVKDVIRTIHIKDGVIRSRGDPFWGHHFACRPFTSVDVPGPMRAHNSALKYSDLNINIEDEFPGELQSSDAQSGISTSTQRVPVVDNFLLSHTHCQGARNSTTCGQDVRADPTTKSRVPTPTPKLWLVRKRNIRVLPQCHLCLKVLPSTELLVYHLQRHIQSSPKCRQCGTRLSPDGSVRRRLRKCLKCENCEDTCLLRNLDNRTSETHVHEGPAIS